MEPLSQLMHAILEAPCTPSCIQGPTLFRTPYPMANPPTAPTMFMHSPNPHLISGANLLASTIRRLNSAEEEYLHTFRLAPEMTQEAPQVPEPPLQAAPQLQLMYIPPWPTVQLGPLPPMPPAQPAPLEPVAPRMPFHEAPLSCITWHGITFNFWPHGNPNI